MEKKAPMDATVYLPTLIHPEALLSLGLQAPSYVLVCFLPPWYPSTGGSDISSIVSYPLFK